MKTQFILGCPLAELQGVPVDVQLDHSVQSLLDKHSLTRSNFVHGMIRRS